jgi:hypothetical protein
MLEELPNFIYMFPCLHGKRSEEIKRELFTEREVLVLMHSPEFGNILEVTLGVPLPLKNALLREPPLGHSPLRKASCVVLARLGKKKRKNMSNNMITLH